MMSELRGRHLYLDTNVFIYALEAYDHPLARGSMRLLAGIEAGDWTGATSELTLAELLVMPLRRGDNEQAQRIRLLIADRPGFRVVPVDRGALVLAAELRAAYGLKLPDAIHIASARQAGCDMVVSNDDAWRQVTGITLLPLTEAGGQLPAPDA